MWDLCGVGRLPKPARAALAVVPPSLLTFALDEDLPAHLGADALQHAREALWQVLDAGSPRWRAAAMVLRGAAFQRLAEQELRDLAQTTADPVIQRWALDSCGDSAICAEPLAQRWALHDADNLAAWAAVLEWAPPQRRDGIVIRMTQATRFLTYQAALSTAVLQAMPESMPTYLHVPLLMEALSAENALPDNLLQIDAYCHAPLQIGSSVYSRCSAIARVIAEHSESRKAAAKGLDLASRTYLSAPEARRQFDLLHEATTLPMAWSFDTRQPLSCTGVQRVRNWVQLVGQHGELGALKALVKAHATPAPAR